jgi:hypothetical protein
LKEGDAVEIELTVVESDRALSGDEKRAAALSRLRNLPRFLPSNFKFSRDEANERS